LHSNPIATQRSDLAEMVTVTRSSSTSVVERIRANDRFGDQEKWSDAAGSYCFVSF